VCPPKGIHPGFKTKFRYRFGDSGIVQYLLAVRMGNVFGKLSERCRGHMKSGLNDPLCCWLLNNCSA